MHLHVVVTNICPDKSFLLLSIASIYPDKYRDPTCVFAGGEHDFIEHASYVEYSKAQMRFANSLEKCLSSKIFVAKDDLEPAQFRRLCDGIARSQRSQPWARAMFAANLPY